MLAAFLHRAPFARLGAKRTRRMQKGAGAFLHSVFRLHSKAQTGKKETAFFHPATPKAFGVPGKKET